MDSATITRNEFSELVMGIAIRNKQKLNKAQLEFQLTVGTDTALFRHIASPNTMRARCILDLKAACDTVPRQELYRLLGRSSTKELINVVGFYLQHMVVKNQNEESGSEVAIAHGVRNGSPLRATLLITSMDIIPPSLPVNKPTGIPTSKQGQHLSNAAMIANDVKLQASSSNCKLNLLNGAGKWTTRYGII